MKFGERSRLGVNDAQGANGDDPVFTAAKAVIVGHAFAVIDVLYKAVIATLGAT